jgi:hypothetical protein
MQYCLLISKVSVNTKVLRPSVLLICLGEGTNFNRLEHRSTLKNHIPYVWRWYIHIRGGRLEAFVRIAKAIVLF